MRGLSALSRLYQADDGWFYLQCTDDQSWASLTRLPELSHLSSDNRFSDPQGRERNDAALAEELSKVFAQGTRGRLGAEPDRRWRQRHGGIWPSLTTNDDSHVRQAGLIVSREHPGMGMADHLGVVARLSGTPARLGRPTPVLGAETNDILAEAGYSAAEIAGPQGRRSCRSTRRVVCPRDSTRDPPRPRRRRDVGATLVVARPPSPRLIRLLVKTQTGSGLSTVVN